MGGLDEAAELLAEPLLRAGLVLGVLGGGGRLGELEAAEAGEVWVRKAYIVEV